MIPVWWQSILEEHFEELQMLGELRRGALGDPDYTREDLRELDERLEAHVDALVLAGERSHPMLLEGLEADEWSVAFAAAWALLRFRDPSITQRVMDAFLAAPEETRDGFREAFQLVPWDWIAARLDEVYQHGEAPWAVIAAEVAAHHGRLRSSATRLNQLLLDPSPAVREAAWRIVGLVDGHPAGSPPTRAR
jgi:uncharacterized protein (TIGR02270 family)